VHEFENVTGIQFFETLCGIAEINLQGSANHVQYKKATYSQQVYEHTAHVFLLLNALLFSRRSHYGSCASQVSVCLVSLVRMEDEKRINWWECSSGHVGQFSAEWTRDQEESGIICRHWTDIWLFILAAKAIFRDDLVYFFIWLAPARYHHHHHHQFILETQDNVRKYRTVDGFLVF